MMPPVEKGAASIASSWHMLDSQEREQRAVGESGMIGKPPKTEWDSCYLYDSVYIDRDSEADRLWRPRGTAAP